MKIIKEVEIEIDVYKIKDELFREIGEEELVSELKSRNSCYMLQEDALNSFTYKDFEQHVFMVEENSVSNPEELIVFRMNKEFSTEQYAVVLKHIIESYHYDVIKKDLDEKVN